VIYLGYHYKMTPVARGQDSA